MAQSPDELLLDLPHKLSRVLPIHINGVGSALIIHIDFNALALLSTLVALITHGLLARLRHVVPQKATVRGQLQIGGTDQMALLVAATHQPPDRPQLRVGAAVLVFRTTGQLVQAQLLQRSTACGLQIFDILSHEKLGISN